MADANEAGMKAALEKSAMESLEVLAFTEAMPEAAPPGLPSGSDCMGAMIPVDRDGRIIMWAERGFLADLAGTLFTIPPEDAGEETLRDTLLEFLNIVAGRFMAADSRMERVLTLGLPREVPTDDGWGTYPVACFLRTGSAGYFSLGLKP